MKFPHPTPEPEIEPMTEMEIQEDIKESIPAVHKLERNVSRNETKIIDQLESLKDKLQTIKGTHSTEHLEKFESITNKLKYARKHLQSNYKFPKSLQ
jgi:hypothetical protein